MKYLCKNCGKWFQINRVEKINSRSLLLSHLSGLSFRVLAESYQISISTAFRKCHEALEELPHCADITRKYCGRFCGILIVDGKYVSVKGYERKIPVIYGIDYLTHDIPTYIFSIAENYPTCHTFFTSLRLLNYPLQAIVSDDNQNIYQSCLSVYPKAISQICQNHYKEGVRSILRVRTETMYRSFMNEIEELFDKRRPVDEFSRQASKIFSRFKDNEVCLSVLLDIQKRLPQLLAYTQIPRVPKTTNLIESYNSHLQGRLETIKGFESFQHADLWLNGYFIRRRLKPFTDCGNKFRNLNGKTSLQLTLNENRKIDTLLNLFR